MKRSRLALSLSAGCILLTGCSYQRSFSSLDSSFDAIKDDSASAQTLSPLERFQSAQTLAWNAALAVNHSPHSTNTWQEARVKWRQAIHLLETIPNNSSFGKKATQKLASYRANYDAIDQRLRNEEIAVESFQRSQALAWQAAVTVQRPPHRLQVWERAEQKWKEAIAALEAVPRYTSLFSKAQEKLPAYRENYENIRRRVQTEKVAAATLQQFSDAADQLTTLQNAVVKGEALDSIGIRYENYGKLVQSLKQSLKELESQPEGRLHPAYETLAAAIADYDFAIDLWQIYQNLRQANAWFLNNEDLYNQLIPLSKIDSTTLLKRYKVKIYQGHNEAKVPLKSTLWDIWEHAGCQTDAVKEKLASMN